MRVLIVEDNSFNAFCLTRLLQTVFPKLEIHSAADSTYAIVIVDGCLGATDGIHCNGPALADAIWSQDNNQHVIAWTDSKAQHQAFAETFKQHRQLFSEATCWPKIVTAERIENALAPVLKASMQRQALATASSHSA